MAGGSADYKFHVFVWIALAAWGEMLGLFWLSVGECQVCCCYLRGMSVLLTGC